MLRRALPCLALLIATFAGASPAAAQDPTPTPSGPIYIVQPNEYLSTIADRFDVDINDLMSVNGITNPDLISEGARLIIPGLEGVTGILDTEIVNFGDSFRSLVRRTQIPLDLLQKLNHVVSPTEFYVGAGMIIPKQEDTTELTHRVTIRAGQSLLELSLMGNTDAWTLSALNGLQGSWDGLPGDSLYTAGAGSAEQLPTGLPPAFRRAEIRTLPLQQGSTAEIIVLPAEGATLGGTLADYPLHFFPLGDGRMIALQGIHAMLEPGVYPLQLDAEFRDGTIQSFQQSLVISDAVFPKESLTVPAESIDPVVTTPEEELVLSIISPVTDQKRWNGVLELPVSRPFCVKDWFGTRRSFNLSDYDYFHAGIDYGICSVEKPFDIYAAAPGVVVFAGPLNVRGNATFIDHGWGIYSGYFHQQEVYVAAGQEVDAGLLIGKIGGTGRVTGPHLHFEVWVDGVQVDPQDWLTQAYP
ncbi:MAG: peptidoglycan DD-metalloendopeptidase family protein [Chloroflexota bacterium]